MTAAPPTWTSLVTQRSWSLPLPRVATLVLLWFWAVVERTLADRD